MKCLLVLALFVAAACAQHNNFDHLIYNEVHAILSANPGISVDDCTTKCDSMFDLIDSHDETHTDKVCRQACDCEIHKTCNHHNHQHPTQPAATQPPTTAAPTNPPHHTHPTHPTHPPHHGHQG